MLQNRVDPTGKIFATPARGLLMGNRGVIHDKSKRIVQPFKHKAWIACALEFKGRHREMMTPDRWTELFFLDEATAFAAGHRPCAECRRERFNGFKQHWLAANPEYKFDKKTSINEIDKIIQSERIDSDGNKVTYQAELKQLATGVFVLFGDHPYLVRDGLLFQWMPSGYNRNPTIIHVDIVTVLTPRSIVNVFRSGYQPMIRGFESGFSR